jgi:phospho-N-acetylmuramoyl-pentapeptide-transferase
MLYWILDIARRWLDEIGLYSVVRVLDQVEFRAFAAAFLSFLLVIVAGRPVIRQLTRLKIGDAGSTDAEALRAHAANKANTPTMGGVLIGGAILVSTVLLADIRQMHVQLGLVVLLWLGVLGGFDDWLKLTARRRGTGRQGLFAWEKMVFQLGLGVIVGFFAYNAGDDPATPLDLAHVLNLPFQRTFLPGGGGVAEGLIYLSAPVFIAVSALLIAGMSNAVNITDGMDGLAGGVSATVSFGLMVLALIAGSDGFSQYLLVPHVAFVNELAVLAGSMAGACIGFLWWNGSPALVFMGDTGSLALGGLIAYLAIVIRQEIAMLIMSGVFLLEIGSVVLQVGYFKATGGKRVFRCAPYHHHLHLGGWTESQVVTRLWIVSILLGLVGLTLLKLR